MSLAQIENQSHADLKANREANLAVVQAATRDEVDTRYLQARTDAVMRDEKLAEQGRTITTLNDLVAEKSATIAKREAECAEAERQLKSTQEAALKLAADADADRAKLSKAIADLKAVNAEIVAERDAAKKLADQRRAALADVMAHAGQLSAKVAPLLVSQE